MMRALKSRLLEAYVDAFFPSLFLFPNPFKIYEFDVVAPCGMPLPGETVLDLGCGGGLHVFAMAERCREAVGLDVSERWIRRAEVEMHRLRPGRRVRFVCSTLEEAGFPEAGFDRIFSFSVLEHIPNAEEVMGECLRILKPGGMIRFSVDWLGSITDRALIAKHRQDHSVVRYWSPIEMTELLRSIGFADISVTPFGCSDAFRRLFEEGICREFKYSYTKSWLDYLRIRAWERRARDRSTGIYLLVQASRPR